MVALDKLGPGMIRLLTALYVSEGWYSHWLRKPNNLYAKARAVVVFDRVLTGHAFDERVGMDTLMDAQVRPC